MKRMLAIIISVMMIITMVPTLAFATGGIDETMFGTVTAFDKDGTQIGVYNSFKDALAVVNDTKTYPGTVKLVCEKDKYIYNGQNHVPVARSILVEGNGAVVLANKTTGEGEVTFAIEESTNIGLEADSTLLTEDTSIVVNNLYNATVWGTRRSNFKLTIQLNNCDTHDVFNKTGHRIYINGATGENDITLTNCDYKNQERCTIYSNAVGNIVVDTCTFNNVGEPININTKAAAGKIDVAVKNTTFNNCGLGNVGDAQWAAPIRVVNSVSKEVTSTLNVDNCIMNYDEGNKPANGDILIGDGRANKTSHPITANIANTQANIRVQSPGYYTSEGKVDETKQVENNVEKTQKAVVAHGDQSGIVIEDNTPPAPPTPSVPSTPSTPEIAPPTGDTEGNMDKPVKPVVPTKVSILKAKNENGRAVLRWSRATNGAEGYRVYRAKAKDGKYTPIAWVKDGKAKTYKEKAKKTNKTYYYKVRAYKTVDGKKVWGAYSPIQKVKF